MQSKKLDQTKILHLEQIPISQNAPLHNSELRTRHSHSTNSPFGGRGLLTNAKVSKYITQQLIIRNLPRNSTKFKQRILNIKRHQISR